MISQTAEYALRAIVYLADQRNEPHTTAQIADASVIPAGYLAKVMQSLGRARLVHSQRGLKGGFVLAKDPKDMTLLEVVNAVDPIRRFHECPLGLATHQGDLCPLHQCLDQAARTLEEKLGTATVADMLKVPEWRQPLCTFPRSAPVVQENSEPQPDPSVT
jgi:Rrf2 family transcriptional regulator, nitric oxide-sensitive transcriptional repressor